MIRFTLNGQPQQTDVEADMPLLWFLRDELGLTGTKYGCGIGQCGACTVLVDGQSLRSCSTPLSAIANKAITTIEGSTSRETQALQQAWLDNNVPQCGYCQSGQLLSASVLLQHNTNPSEADIETAMSGHICRCGTYGRIKVGVQQAADHLAREVN